MIYSDIFNSHTVGDVTVLNLLDKIELPSDRSNQIYTTYLVPSNLPWITLSWMIYGDISYYWVLMLCNEEKHINPLIAEAGSIIHIIKPDLLDDIINDITTQIDATKTT